MIVAAPATAAAASSAFAPSAASAAPLAGPSAGSASAVRVRRGAGPLAVAGLSLALLAPSALAQSTAIDPRGIFFNRFTGSFGGTEWFQTIPLTGTNRYRVADIFGGGFDCTITPEGIVTLDAGVGTGSFSTPDRYVIRPNLGGTVFTFTNTRAPGTAPDFPLSIVSPIAGNPLLAGTYRTLTQPVNPETGLVAAGGFENNTITVLNTTFRITDPGGLFFQGIFESPTRVSFRVVSPTPGDARFRSIPGSAINFTQNMMGSVRVTSVNTFTAVFLLQSRTPLGSQTQSVFFMDATRIDPLPQGDLNGDRAVTDADRTLLLAQIGLTAESDAFNIAADLDLDGDVDAADLALLNAIIPCPADFNADTTPGDIFDLFDFLTALDGGLDFNNDTTPADIFDLFDFLAALDAGCP